MASQEQIKEAILRVAGNPDSGVVADLANEFAIAIVELDQQKRETRIVTAKEIR
jgi:hypothetical protein